MVCFACIEQVQVLYIDILLCSALHPATLSKLSADHQSSTACSTTLCSDVRSSIATVQSRLGQVQHSLSS